MVKPIDDFVNRISTTSEYDYGDFIRIVNTYINQLRTELYIFEETDVDKKISEMQVYIQYSPNWDVESTKEKLIEDSKYLNDLVLAHQQDWESVPLEL